jgi:DNA-directed RNA polymerase subunit RPC12/RpoP
VSDVVVRCPYCGGKLATLTEEGMTFAVGGRRHQRNSLSRARRAGRDVGAVAWSDQPWPEGPASVVRCQQCAAPFRSVAVWDAAERGRRQGKRSTQLRRDPTTM